MPNSKIVVIGFNSCVFASNLTKSNANSSYLARVGIPHQKIAEEDMHKAKGGKHIESGGWPVRTAKVLVMAASINLFFVGMFE